MQRYGRPYLKPSVTWGLIRVFALHKIYYGTIRPCRSSLRRIIRSTVCGLRIQQVGDLLAGEHSAGEPPKSAESSSTCSSSSSAIRAVCTAV